MTASIDIPGGGAGRWPQDPPETITVTVVFAGSPDDPRTYDLAEGAQAYQLREKIEEDTTSPFHGRNFTTQPLLLSDIDGVVEDYVKLVDGRKYGVRVKMFDDKKGKDKPKDEGVFDLEV